MDVGVRFLDLVEEHHAVWTAPDRFGQDASLAVADVSGRRALERRDGVRLLELAHVDGDDVLLAAVQRLGERERGFRLAHARRPAEHEDTNRLVRIVQLRAGGLNSPGDHLERVPLPDHALIQRLGQLQHGFELVLHHAPDRNTGPVLHDRGYCMLVDAGKDQRRFTLKIRQLLVQPGQLGEQLRARHLGEPAARSTVRQSPAPPRPPPACCPVPSTRSLPGAKLGADRQDAVDELALLPPALLELGASTLGGRHLLGRGRAPRARLDADRFLASDDLELDLQRLDLPPDVLERRRNSVLTHRDARRSTCRAGSRPCRGAAAPEYSDATT